ncbi:MAG: phosphatase PAP2 family protein [Notoacmeibacter sp.]
MDKQTSGKNALERLQSIRTRAGPYLVQAKETVRSNFKMIEARHLRIGANTKTHWWPIFEICVVVAVVIICCFALVDRSVALQRGQLPELFVHISSVFTRFGKSDWIIIPTALALLALLLLNPASLSKAKLFRLYRWNLWLSFILAGVGLPSLAATLLKRIIGRPRPSQLAEYGLYDFQHFHFDAAFASFPSGHSTTIGAFAVVMALLLPKFRVVFFAFAVFVGFSRVGVGAHHPSDVIAGLTFGAIGAFLIAKWFASRGILFLSTQKQWPSLRHSMRLFSSRPGSK